MKVQKKKAIHAGKALVDRPIITIWALRSANAEGALVDWPVPDVMLSQVYVDDSELQVVGGGEGDGKVAAKSASGARH